MAVIIKTEVPNKLLAAIKKEISEGKIETWSFDSDGDFTHTPAQWEHSAWLRPKVYTGELRFGILKNKNVELSKVIYGVFHGRFAEMLLDHFDNMFTVIEITAHKTEPDNF